MYKYKDKEKEYKHNYHLAHKEKNNANSKRHYYEHRDEELARHKIAGPVYKRTFRGRYTGLKFRAKKNNFSLDIDFETFCRLIDSGRCSYCGGNLPETGISLDRKDHTQGYLVSNVVPCCTKCNQLKGLLEAAGFCYPRTVELLTELRMNYENVETKLN